MCSHKNSVQVSRRSINLSLLSCILFLLGFYSTTIYNFLDWWNIIADIRTFITWLL